MCRSASTGNNDDASDSRARGRQRCRHPHAQDGFKLAAEDKIQAHITCESSWPQSRTSKLTRTNGESKLMVAELPVGSHPVIGIFE